MKKVKTKLNFVRRFKKLSPKKRYVISSLFFLFIAAIFLTWFLEYRYFVNDMWFDWNFVFTRPRIFFFNAVLVYLLLLALWSILGRPSFSVGLTWIAIIIITYIHINKVATRAYPLLPEDFQLAGAANSLSRFIDLVPFVKLALACVIVVIITTIFAVKAEQKLCLRNPSHSKKFLKRHMIGLRLVVLALSVLGFMNITEFVRHNSGERYEDIPFLKSRFIAWNQTWNYNDNGFILGFLYNLQKLNITEPEDYSEEYISMLNEHYGNIAKTKNESRKNPADDDISVVVILNESFFDPSVEWQGQKFEDYYPHSGGEITPNLRKIQSKYPSGYMYSIDYGGGTANIEFEALTGLSDYWLNTVPYTAIVPKLNRVPSIANMLKNEGYTASAIHPFNGGMYKRNISLKKEGFDDFITEMEMDYTDHEGDSEYVNDRSAYRQTLKELESGNKRQVIALITMQNHTPYPSSIYEHTDYKVTGDNIDEQRRQEIETYYQSLHNSDAYLGEFIDSLEHMDKKVVVLYFGDHSAGLFDNVNENDNKNVRDLARLTPYFVYSNFDVNYKTKDLPTTTPNCMVNTMFNTMNWQKNARHYLLDDVCSEEPILAQTYFDGRDFTETETLRKYRLLIYDLMSGSGYWKE
jgi:phosphoglycerol transferase MdoB-like AlkP superfamily enzyme